MGSRPQTTTVPELAISDFPGELNWAQKQAAQRIISRFNGQRASLPVDVANKIVALAKDGLPHWKKASTTSPVPHKYYRHMHGPRSKLKQRSLCWEKWWVLAAIYGHTHPRLWPALVEFRRRLSRDQTNTGVTGMRYPGPIPGYESDSSSDGEEEPVKKESRAASGSSAQKSDHVDSDGDTHSDDDEENDEHGGDEESDGDEEDNHDNGAHGADPEHDHASVTPTSNTEAQRPRETVQGISAANSILIIECNSGSAKSGPGTVPDQNTSTTSADKKRKRTPSRKSESLCAPGTPGEAGKGNHPRERRHAHGITHNDLVRRLFSAEARLLAVENDRRADEEHAQDLASRVSSLKAAIGAAFQDQHLLGLRVAKLEARGDGIKEVLSLRRAMDTVQGNIAEMDRAAKMLEVIVTGAGAP